MADSQPDLSIFKHDAPASDDDDCKNHRGKTDCVSVRRLIAAHEFYQALQMSSMKREGARTRFIAFCDASYSLQSMLADHIHFVRAHSGDASRRRIADSLDHRCASLSDCGCTARHFRGRNKENENKARSLCEVVMDSLHLTLFHLEQIGMRISGIKQKKKLKKDDTDDGDSMVDAEMSRMALEIHRARTAHVFPRIDASNNAKFNIAKQTDGSEETKSELEGMREHIAARVDDETAKRDFYEFIASEEFETDSVQLDVADAANSNLRRRAKKEIFDALCEFLRILMHRVDAASLSTGFLFSFWPWYQEQSDADVKRDFTYSKMDFSGYTVAELCVSAYYDALKSEVLGSGFVGIKAFEETVVGKGNAYLKTKICRKMKSPYGDFLHYDIPPRSPLRAHHLYALILYCDFSDYCFEFGRSFRKMKWSENIGDVKKRNAKFYFVSRYLREAVQYFGIHGFKEKGPFFTGMSCVLNIPSFSVSFNGPTSTSKQKVVATLYADDNGMVVVLDNRRGHTHDISIVYFCTFLSDEYESEYEDTSNLFPCPPSIDNAVRGCQQLGICSA